jgi:hypothetical protein
MSAVTTAASGSHWRAAALKAESRSIMVTAASGNQERAASEAAPVPAPASRMLAIAPNLDADSRSTAQAAA